MNYTFTNKNKRNKDKLLCKNFSKYYFDFLVINNIFHIINLKIEKKIIFLILVNYHNILQNIIIIHIIKILVVYRVELKL